MTSRIPLKVVTAPTIGVVLKAPPVLMASEHSVDYTCGRQLNRQLDRATVCQHDCLGAAIRATGE